MGSFMKYYFTKSMKNLFVIWSNLMLFIEETRKHEKLIYS